jgi:hypothetical protein
VVEATVHLGAMVHGFVTLELVRCILVDDIDSSYRTMIRTFATGLRVRQALSDTPG